MVEAILLRAGGREMRLYFLRHGIAAPRSEWRGDEVLRPLTDTGRRRLRQVAAFLAQQRLTIDLVITSPLVRCVQTARIVARRLELPDRLVLDERLAPGFGPSLLGRIVRDHADADGLMLVGHETDFSVTIGKLIGGGRVVCRKGGVACVNVLDNAARQGELEWLIPPGLVSS
jgi:phosphohistidine phosphatase